jgi:Na+-transporting NADH:ubiquinone oxidoreductase subunit C
MNKIFGSVVRMFLIALVFTTFVSVVKLLSENRIERNQQVKLQRTILNVLGLTVKGKTNPEDIFNIFNERVKPITFDNKIVYIGYEKNGRDIKGYAFSVGGPGFWGPVECMVAINPDATKMLGIAFYKQSETPGLGARITEDWFSKQFKGLRLFPIDQGKNIFYLTPHKMGKPPGDLDAITGATGTSTAVEKFLNRELKIFLKRFRSNFIKD